MATEKTTKRTAKKAASTPSESTFSAEEKAAIKQYAKEKRRTKAEQNGEQDVLDAIAGFSGTDKAVAEGLHALVKRIAPELEPRTWYGFPAYSRDGKVVFFWQYAAKFKSRYGHIGFNDSAALDDGEMWPTTFAITAWNPEIEAAVEKLITKALGK